MKSSRLKPLIFLAIPLAVGGLAALFSAGSMDKFSALNQPPLSPPGWLFPIVWGILYILMGTASYIIYSSDAPEISKKKALGLYLVQLGLNFLWPILFFTFGLCTAAAVLIVILWVLILLTLLYFYRISKHAGYLIIPYFLWVIRGVSQYCNMHHKLKRHLPQTFASRAGGADFIRNISADNRREPR